MLVTDVGDGYWRVLARNLRCWRQFWPFSSPYLLALTSGTNIHKISSVSKLCNQCPKIVTDTNDRPLSQMTVHFHQDCRSSIFGKLKLSFRENFVLLPDQIQFLNPIMVLILIPCFNYILYPLFAKAGFQNRATFYLQLSCAHLSCAFFEN